CAWSGLLREGMAANDAALAGLADIDDFDREFIGFDVDQWAHGIRVRLLNRLGRFDDTLQYLARISERASARVDPVMKQIAHHVYIDLAWCSGRKGFVAEHAEHVLQIAEASRSSYTRIFAYSSCGIASLVLGDHAQARSAFNEALTHLRQSRAAIEFEPEVLAGLAECSLALGLLDEATNQAELAINAATHQSNRIAECRSLIALANALAQRGQPARTPRLLQRAEDLIDITGACVLRPRLDAARENCLRTLAADAAPRSAAGAHQ
ncbi:MAG: hypothetical protein JSS56_24530, partial [Proteobacteria bacterium]|nr:hypothetical protein [Pseudomonadota bacterium]